MMKKTDQRMLEQYNGFKLSWLHDSLFFIIAIAVIFGSLFNNIGILGYLPILANVVQSIVVLNKKTTARQLQFMFAFVSLCWAVYNFVIKAYAGAVFDAINMLSFLFNGIMNKTGEA